MYHIQKEIKIENSPQSGTKYHNYVCSKLTLLQIVSKLGIKNEYLKIWKA